MRFYLATISELASAEQCNSKTNFIKEKGWAYWHHIGNSWLIGGADESRDAAALRDKIVVCAPNVIALVIRFETENWAAMSPASSHEWLRKHLSSIDRTSLSRGHRGGRDQAVPK